MDDSTLMTAEDVATAQLVIKVAELKNSEKTVAHAKRILATYHALAAQTEEVARLKAPYLLSCPHCSADVKWMTPSGQMSHLIGCTDCAIGKERNEADALRAALAEAQKDGARLDWLIANAYTNAALNVDLTHPLAIGLVIGGRIEWPDGLRPAIDAARSEPTP